MQLQRAIIGKKVGMTQIFDATGKVIPVTVVEAGPCTVTQIKTVEKDGYASIQLGYADISDKKLTKLEREKMIETLTAEMREAARTLEFEKAAYLRDKIRELKAQK